MNDDEVAAKLSARIRSWKSCVGSDLEWDTPPQESLASEPGSPQPTTTRSAVAESCHAVVAAPPTDLRDDHIHRLEERLAAERRALADGQPTHGWQEADQPTQARG